MGAGAMMRLGAQLYHRGVALRGLRRHSEQSWCCPEAVARSGVPGLCVAMCCVSVGIEGLRFSGEEAAGEQGRWRGKGIAAPGRGASGRSKPSAEQKSTGGRPHSDLMLVGRELAA